MKRVEEDGVYVISGGTGGIGYVIAKWLREECGARHIISLTRSGTKRDGVVSVKCDISNKEQVLQCISGIKRPICGIIHAADQVLQHKWSC